MTKTILITGSTDGIGLLTARVLAEKGHRILVHGRSAQKAEASARQIGGAAQPYVADLSSLEETKRLAASVAANHDSLDVLINNAGVFKMPEPVLPNGQDARFVVNTLAPYRLTLDLLPIIPGDGRIVNVSSAAQAEVNVDALEGKTRLGDMEAYAQSKLGLIIWSQAMAKELPEGPTVLAVNPGSLLASKMVKEGFGLQGNDLSIGATILGRLATEQAFSSHTGQYWDNDTGGFSAPHATAADARHAAEVMGAIKANV